MVDSKSRYEESRVLMNTLPPIKEESFLSTSSGGTPRNVQRVSLKNTQFLVQTLPPDPSQWAPPTPIEEVTSPIPHDEQDSVDQIVEDYLHYARYSATVPVRTEQWDSNEALYCSCCTDRNKQNIRRQHGLPVEQAEDREADDIETRSNSKSPRVDHSQRESWMRYQPLPYAKTYLNPEFNRPSVIEQYQQEMKVDKESAKTRAQILESNTKFEQAMKKLKFTTQKLDPDFDESKMSFF